MIDLWMGKMHMENIWTIQSKKVLDIVQKEGIYYPNIRFLQGNYQGAYKIVLDSFNIINNCKYDGLIYGFAKYGEKRFFNSIDELYQYFLGNPSIADAFDFWSDQYVILQLQYEKKFNLVPIDFNDFIQIMPPIGDRNAYQIIVSRIRNGIYKGGYTLPSFTQVHTPYIKKENIIGVFENFNKKKSDETGVLHTYTK